MLARSRRIKRKKNNVEIKRFYPVFGLIVSISLCFLAASYAPAHELLVPADAYAFESYPSQSGIEPAKQEIKPEMGEIESYIMEVFGEDGEKMIKIAKCESGLKSDTVGDKHLLGDLNGEQIGDSIGLFQIRTGDPGTYDKKPWSRAKANGMTVEEFRAYLKNPINNIDYAKTIYDNQGIYAWYNCQKKVL